MLFLKSTPNSQALTDVKWLQFYSCQYHQTECECYTKASTLISSSANPQTTPVQNDDTAFHSILVLYHRFKIRAGSLKTGTNQKIQRQPFALESCNISTDMKLLLCSLLARNKLIKHFSWIHTAVTKRIKYVSPSLICLMVCMDVLSTMFTYYIHVSFSTTILQN